MTDTSADRFATFAPMPGIDAIDVWRPAAALRVSIAADAAPPTYSTTEELRWHDLCAANPRVHDGPILAVHSINPLTSTYTCRRDRYKRLAVQPRHIPPPAGVWILGVKGWITARDTSGAEHLLIARRGPQTRIYADLWESAPAGGVDPPREIVTELSVASLAESLSVEAEEELGIDLDTRHAHVVGVCRDYTAGSDDIFIRVELPNTIDPRHSPSCQHARNGWEYSDTAWLARADAPAFDARTKPTIVPPTRAMLRLMGWVT